MKKFIYIVMLNIYNDNILEVIVDNGKNLKHKDTICVGDWIEVTIDLLTNHDNEPIRTYMQGEVLAINKDKTIKIATKLRIYPDKDLEPVVFYNTYSDKTDHTVVIDLDDTIEISRLKK